MFNRGRSGWGAHKAQIIQPDGAFDTTLDRRPNSNGKTGHADGFLIKIHKNLLMVYDQADIFLRVGDVEDEPVGKAQAVPKRIIGIHHPIILTSRYILGDFVIGSGCFYKIKDFGV